MEDSFLEKIAQDDTVDQNNAPDNAVIEAEPIIENEAATNQSKTEGLKTWLKHLKPKKKIDKKNVGLTIKRHEPSKVIHFGRTVVISVSDRYLEFVMSRNLGFKSSLINITRIELPENRQEPEFSNFITESTIKYKKKHGNRFTRYIMSIGGKNAAFRTITLPSMSDKELTKAVYWKAKKRIPFNIDDSRYGYHKTETVQDGDNESITAAVLAVSRPDIDKRIRFIEPISDLINCVGSDLEALGQLLPYLPDFKPNQSNALINIKENYTEISFYRGSNLEFMHVASVGYKGVDLDNVGDRKYMPFIESLVNEIQNSLDFYVGQFSGTSAERVYIYGDLSYAADILITLTNRFGLDFTCFPLEHIINKNPQSKQFAESIPLSLGACALSLSNTRLINFLPEDMLEKQIENKFYRLSIPALIGLVGVLFLSWFIMKGENEILFGKAASLDNQIMEIQSSPAFLMYNRIKNQMAVEQALLNSMNHKPTRLNLSLKDLSRITPKQIELQQMELNVIAGQNVLTIAGNVISSDPPPEVILAEFIAGMEGSPFFKNIAIKKHVKKGQNNKFNLEFLIGADAVI